MGIQLRDPEQPVGTLSGGERQCLAIARAIHFGAKVLILDEPTSALGVHQASVVLKLIVQSKARGIGVIFISHNVHHAYVVGDRFTHPQARAKLGHLCQGRDQPRPAAQSHGGRQGTGRSRTGNRQAEWPQGAGAGDAPLNADTSALALIGTGFMGKCHAMAYGAVKAVFGDVPHIERVTLCDVDEAHHAEDGR